MSLSLGNCGRLMKEAVDALSNEEKKDRDAVFSALGRGVENYVQSLLQQLQIVVAPTPGLGLTTTPGNPTGPGPAPVPLQSLPGGLFK